MIYIGIDPGKKGALALLDTRENNKPLIIPFDPEKYIDTLWAIKCDDEPCICCIEQVHALQGNGVTSSFEFGKTYGWLLGMLDAIGIPYQPISPQKWKKEFGLISKDKADSIDVCKRLFPGVILLRTERSRVDDNNMAESALLALYAKRKF